VGEVRLESVWVDYRAPRRSRRGRRPRIWALQDVSLALGPGERLGVIGGNGSGKTTLLQTIGGVFVPTAGRAEAGGRVASVIELSAGPQRDLSGHENLQIEASLLGIDKAELEARYEDILDLAALPPESLDQPVYTYSTGMMLRLRLALAIGCDPDLLVVDEVLAVADARFQERYLARIGALCQRGACLVLASHNLQTIAEHTERALVLDGGRPILTGPARHAVARYEEAVSEIASAAAGGNEPRTGHDAAVGIEGPSLAERLARTTVDR
jgi:ABC-type polysaccharide/polyol phosphate transport system ATPase subunit